MGTNVVNVAGERWVCVDDKIKLVVRFAIIDVCHLYNTHGALPSVTRTRRCRSKGVDCPQNKTHRSFDEV